VCDNTQSKERPHLSLSLHVLGIFRGQRVVGFEVEPLSVDMNEIKFEGEECNFPDNPKPQHVNKNDHTSLFFTYSVIWKESQVKWASRYALKKKRLVSPDFNNSLACSFRWDYLLGMNDVQIHWFSIINSLIVVFFLSGTT
jgi:transmembrane 9 superfamily protein 2/4